MASHLACWTIALLAVMSVDIVRGNVHYAVSAVAEGDVNCIPGGQLKPCKDICTPLGCDAECVESSKRCACKCNLEESEKKIPSLDKCSADDKKCIKASCNESCKVRFVCLAGEIKSGSCECNGCFKSKGFPFACDKAEDCKIFCRERNCGQGSCSKIHDGKRCVCEQCRDPKETNIEWDVTTTSASVVKVPKLG